MTPLPQGMRATLHVYLINDDGRQAFVTIRNMKMVPGEMEPVDANQLVRVAKLDERGIGWRVMTDAEITEYLADQENDQ